MARRPAPLPAEFPRAFGTASARDHGATVSRLRRDDLHRPHRGVRVRRDADPVVADGSPQARERAAELARIEALAARDVPGQFFSHRSAALLWGVPLPHEVSAPLHLSVHRPVRAPRVSGVIGHSLDPARFELAERHGISCTSAASTWASLGSLSVLELVQIGDHLVREHRRGHGRPLPGRRPHTTRDELSDLLANGRWAGAARLREALGLIREDSWSPAETETRLVIVGAGLPEPELNFDVFHDHGWFIACIDLAYPQYRIAIEYQSTMHAESYARDVERIERLRAAGWLVIQVTASLLRSPARLAERVRAALHERGWLG